MPWAATSKWRHGDLVDELLQYLALAHVFLKTGGLYCAGLVQSAFVTPSPGLAYDLLYAALSVEDDYKFGQKAVA